MDTLPDLSLLSDDEITALLRQLGEREDAVSRRRRLLHGRIDILRSERITRLKAHVAEGDLDLHAPESLERPLYTGTGELPDEVDLDPLPDLTSFDDDTLHAEVRKLEQEEDDISLARRVLHAQIDIVHAERSKRSRGAHVEAGDLGPILGGGT